MKITVLMKVCSKEIIFSIKKLGKKLNKAIIPALVIQTGINEKERKSSNIT